MRQALRGQLARGRGKHVAPSGTLAGFNPPSAEHDDDAHVLVHGCL